MVPLQRLAEERAGEQDDDCEYDAEIAITTEVGTRSRARVLDARDEEDVARDLEEDEDEYRAPAPVASTVAPTPPVAASQPSTSTKPTAYWKTRIVAGVTTSVPRFRRMPPIPHEPAAAIARRAVRRTAGSLP